MKRGILTAVIMAFLVSAGAGTAYAEGSSWVEDHYGWRFQLEDGTSPENRWMLIDDRWYYFDKEGYAVSGWRRIDGEYYYFKETSCAMVQGWHYDEDDGHYYYLDKGGARHTGWLYENGGWYWFNSRGQMADDGFTMAQMRQYYFYENGQMAANQYVGLKYYDENGQEDSGHNIIRVGDGTIAKEDKDAVTEALKDVPREWIKDFTEQGWQLMYYTERSYFSAPDTEEGVYYVYHQVDERYKKLKFTKPEALTQAFGEYIGYRLGLYDNPEESLVAGIAAEMENLSRYVSLPSYFDEKEPMQFGMAFKAFINPDNQDELMRTSPEVYEFLEKMIYPSGRPRRLDGAEDIFAEES